MPEGLKPPLPAGSLALGLDFGDKRIGVALGDTVTKSAQPLGVVRATDGVPDWAALAKHVSDWRPRLLVLGVPYNMDDSEGRLTRRAQAFGRELSSRFGIAVVTVDERLSSREAAERLKARRQQGLLQRRVRREDVDAIAACVLLEQWLHEQ